MDILVTFTATGADNTVYSLYTDADGYTTPLATGIPKLDLTLGYRLNSVPVGTTIIRAVATGVCTNVLNMPVDFLPIPAPYTFTIASATTSVACSKVIYPSTFYTDDVLFGVGTIFYEEAGLVTPVDGANAWFKSEDTGKSYQISGLGVVTAVFDCGLYAFEFTTTNQNSAVDACSEVTSVTLYSNVTTLATGSVLYTDVALTSTVDGQNKYRKYTAGPLPTDKYVMKITNAGVINSIIQP
jgi:hypothetical protein